MEKKYVNYHCHSSLSNLIIADSPATIDDYISRLKELNHSVYVSTEHGLSFNWIEKYLRCKKEGLKFVYGVEAYLEDEGKVYHLMLMAKTQKGMYQINDCLNYAVYNNYKYRRPRITIETIKEFINPKEVVITTACIAGLVGRENFAGLKQLMEFMGENLWLEIGTSNTEKQRTLNRTVLAIHKKRPIHKIVVGLDSHFIYPEERTLRDSLVESKGIFYDEDEDESDWDMDFPSYEEVVRRLKTQNVLSDKEIFEAIDNTNIIESFDNIEFDSEWKVPSLYPELSKDERDKLLIEKAFENWLEFSKTIPEEEWQKYKSEIKKELLEWIKCGFSDYLLTTSAIVKKGVELGGVITKSARGSASSFITITLFGLSTVDRVSAKLPLLQERFLNADRIIESKSAPDIDINVYNREKFIDAQDELLGEKNNYQIMALGKLKEKSAFRMLCKIKDIDMDTQKLISDKLSEMEKAMRYADDESREFITVEKYIKDKELLKIYKESEKFLGVVSDLKASPCSWAISPFELDSMFGLMKTPNGDIVLNVEGKNIESLGIVKLDWLSVDVVGNIAAVYNEIGIETPSSNELSKMVYNDKPTWDIYSKGITCCVNQCESSRTTEKVMRYKPKTIEELTAFVAGIRPSFASNYDLFEKREKFEYGVPVLDKLFQGEFLENSFILYQEQILLLLKFLGFKAKERYGILKAISKKKRETIESVKGKFYEKMKEITSDIEKIDMIWQVILDSAGYGFNVSHAYCMAFDSLYMAYAKAHYPRQTYVALIQFYTKKRALSKVAQLKQEAKTFFGIEVENRKFGQDNRKMNVTKEGKIYQALDSIKGINSEVGDKMYSIKDVTGDMLDIYLAMKEIGLTKTQIENLAKIGYFENNDEMLWISKNYKQYSNLKKSVMNDIAETTNIDERQFISSLYNKASKETAKMLKFDNRNTVFRIIYENTVIPTMQKLERVFWELHLIGENITEMEQYNFFIVEKYSENRGSLLLLDSENKLEWYWYKKNSKFKSNDILAAGKDIEYTKRGAKKLKMVFNLTQLYK